MLVWRGWYEVGTRGEYVTLVDGAIRVGWAINMRQTRLFIHL